MFRGLQFSLIFGAGRQFLRLLFRDLVDQFLVFGLLVNDVAHLRLPIELDQQIAFAYSCTVWSEVNDRQGSNLLASQQGREYGTSVDSLSGAFEAEYLARLIMDRNRDRASGRMPAMNGES